MMDWGEQIFFSLDRNYTAHNKSEEKSSQDFWLEVNLFLVVLSTLFSPAMHIFLLY